LDRRTPRKMGDTCLERFSVLKSEQTHGAHEARLHPDADSELPHDNNSTLSGIQRKEILSGIQWKE